MGLFQIFYYLLEPVTTINFIDDRRFVQLLNINQFDDGFNLCARLGITNDQLLNICGGIPCEEIDSIEMAIQTVSESVL